MIYVTEFNLPNSLIFFFTTKTIKVKSLSQTPPRMTIPPAYCMFVIPWSEFLHTFSRKGQIFSMIRSVFPVG